MIKILVLAKHDALGNVVPHIRAACTFKIFFISPRIAFESTESSFTPRKESPHHSMIFKTGVASPNHVELADTDRQ